MFEKVKVSKWMVPTVILIIVLLTISFIYLHKFENAPSVSVKPHFLNVSISGSKTLGVNETVTYLASANNSLSNGLSFSWSITPANNNIALVADGAECNLTLVSATTESYMLSVNVKENLVGALGFASIIVYDPNTSSNLHLDTSTSIYSYTIQTDGFGWYEAVNGATGQVFSQSTNSSTMFSNVVEDCPAYGSIDVKSGIYTVATTWTMTSLNYVTLNFESGAELVAANSLNNPVLFLNQCNNDTVNGITINGNGANQNPGNGNLESPQGILIADGSNDMIENSIIYNPRVFGVTISGDTGLTYTNDGVINCTIYCSGGYSGWNGITIGCSDLTNCYAINNNIYGWSDVGITSYGVNDIITGNYIHDITGNNNDPGNGGDAHWGIANEWNGGSGTGGASGYELIAGNTIKNCGAGIAIDTSENSVANYILISGNTLINCNVGGGSGGSLYLGDNPSTSHDIVEFNSITGPSSIGIALLEFIMYR